MFSLMTRSPNGSFDSLLTDWLDGRTSQTRGHSTVQPYAQVTKGEKGYSITVEMPGLSRSDIEVSIENHYLTVSGTRETNGSKLTYSRSWVLGENITQDDITARYEAGLLSLEVPVLKPKKRLVSVE